jgi:hypothetical protein
MAARPARNDPFDSFLDQVHHCTVIFLSQSNVVVDTFSTMCSEYSGSLSKPDNMLPFEPLVISEHAFIPALPVSYVFTPVSTSSTALVTSGASSPLATITVVCDSLAPELLSTQITRGNQSEVIGEFK